MSLKYDPASEAIHISQEEVLRCRAGAVEDSQVKKSGFGGSGFRVDGVECRVWGVGTERL